MHHPSSANAIASLASVGRPSSSVVATLTPGPRDISFVYTAMHGVGWEVAARVFTEAGFTRLVAHAHTAVHRNYLELVGFRPEGNAYVLDLS